MYPALRSDRFDPLEQACDSAMLANLPRDARAASLRFYAGFLNRPDHGSSALEPSMRWQPPRQSDARPGARALRPGACVSTARPRRRPDSHGLSDGIPGSRGACRRRRRQPPFPPGRSRSDVRRQLLPVPAPDLPVQRPKIPCSGSGQFGDEPRSVEHLRAFRRQNEGCLSQESLQNSLLAGISAQRPVRIGRGPQPAIPGFGPYAR